MSKHRVIFPPPDYWNQSPQEDIVTDFNPDDVINLEPAAVAIRYGQGSIDAEGYITEAFRVELNTDLGPFALTLPPPALVELAQHLLAAYNKLPAERAAWASRRDGGQPA